MFRTKVFSRKTKSRGVMKIIREHYLRDNITCGCQACKLCDHPDYLKPTLESGPKNRSSLCQKQHCLLPETNVVLHRVKHRSLPAYKRLKDILANPDKHFYLVYS